MKEACNCIKNSIKDLVKKNGVEISTIKKTIKIERDIEKVSRLQYKLYCQKMDARYLLNVYAFIRNVSYKKTENKVREENKLNLNCLFGKVHKFIPTVTREEIKEWLIQ